MTKILAGAVIALSLFMSFFGLGSFSLFDVDEAVFAQASKEMLESGDWVTPTYNGQNRYDKPILIYWLMAASYRLFGVNEFAARLPSALSASLLALSIFFFVLVAGGGGGQAQSFTARRGRAFLASLSFVLSFFYLAYSHAAVTDMALSLFVSLALFCFYLSFSPQGPKRLIYGLYFFSALAFLTKGLIGVVFPFGIAFLYALIRGGLSGIRRVISPAGIALFLIVSLPWYAAQLVINGEEFVRLFFLKHHLARYTSVISGHEGPFYYYAVVLVAGLFPWVGYLPAGIRDALRQKGSSPGLFALIWLSLVVAFFSLSTTKLPNYVLPAVPAASVLMAGGMADLNERWRRLSTLITASLAALAGGGLFILKGRLSGEAMGELPGLDMLGVLCFMMAAAGFYGAFRKKAVLGVLSAIMAALLVFALAKTVPAASGRLQGALHRYSLYAKERLGEDGLIVCYKLNAPSVVFYSGRRAEVINSMEDLMAVAGKGGHAIFFSKAKHMEDLRQAGVGELIYSDDRYAVFERK